MAEYIERKAVNNICLKHYNESFNDIPAHEALYAVTNDIHNIPSADVVEVVRCKDCIHLKAIKNTEGESNLFCSCFPMQSTSVCFDDFCSYGERRSEE